MLHPVSGIEQKLFCFLVYFTGLGICNPAITSKEQHVFSRAAWLNRISMHHQILFFLSAWYISSVYILLMSAVGSALLWQEILDKIPAAEVDNLYADTVLVWSMDHQSLVLGGRLPIPSPYLSLGFAKANH